MLLDTNKILAMDSKQKEDLVVAVRENGKSYRDIPQ